MSQSRPMEAVFELAGDEETDQGGDQGGDSGEQVEAVDAGDEEERVGALAGVVVDTLRGELVPGGELAGDEENA